MNSLRLDNGRPAQLGTQLASAGEGVVYEVVGHPEWVAKIFHTTFNGVTTAAGVAQKVQDLVAKRKKVSAMVQRKPPGRLDRSGHVVLAWPEHVVRDDGTVVGFVMPKVNLRNSVEIHQLTNKSDRLHPHHSDPQWVTGFTWRYMVNIALNLCSAVGVAHSVGAVIGDFNERNILVSKTTGVTLIDCDSMQLRATGHEQFLCGVGRPEYTAPELLGKDLRLTVRRPESDLFALAVHIYMLLLDGAHPFQAGTWTKGGEKPKCVVLARDGHFAGGPGSPLKPQSTAPPLTILPLDLQMLMTRALAKGASDPAQRPTHAEWGHALMKMIRTL